MPLDSSRSRLRNPLVAVLILAGALALAAAILSPPAFGAPPVAIPGAQSAGKVAGYWTPDRMRGARPMKPVTVTPESSGPVPSTAQVTSQTAGPVPYSSIELTDTVSFPNRVQGKVFFTRPGVGNFVCSGTAVDAGNRSTVITAGHCIHQGGIWSTNFAFAPAYHNVNGIGVAPYGLWAASDELAPEPWIDNENLKYDLGAAVLAKNSNGQLIENVVGGRSVTFNQSAAQYFRSYGYPAQATTAHNWDGTRLWACDSNPPLLDNPGGASGPATMGIGCDMTGGSSGGGWAAGGASGPLDGLNSYKYTNQPDLMYGPYFGATAQALYSSAGAEAAGSPSSAAIGHVTPARPEAGTTSKQPSCRKPRKKAHRARASARRSCKLKRASRSR
jgi:hypothetical protein